MGKGSEEKQRWVMKRTAVLVLYALKPTMESFLCAQILVLILSLQPCCANVKFCPLQTDKLWSVNWWRQLPPWCPQQHHGLCKVKDLDYKTTAEFSCTNESCKIPVWFPIQSSHAILYVAKTTEDKISWSLQQLYLHFDVIELHQVQRHQK